MWNREPWQGQSKDLASWLKLTEQPRWEQFCANTFTSPPCLTMYPPNASSPAWLSPPPSAMMKAELGLVGARIFVAVPSSSRSNGLSSVTLMGPLLCPFGGAGPKYTRIGA